MAAICAATLVLAQATASHAAPNDPPGSAARALAPRPKPGIRAQLTRIKRWGVKATAVTAIAATCALGACSSAPEEPRPGQETTINVPAGHQSHDSGSNAIWYFLGGYMVGNMMGRSHTYGEYHTAMGRYHDDLVAKEREIGNLKATTAQEIAARDAKIAELKAAQTRAKAEQAKMADAMKVHGADTPVKTEPVKATLQAPLTATAQKAFTATNPMVAAKSPAATTSNARSTTAEPNGAGATKGTTGAAKATTPAPKAVTAAPKTSVPTVRMGGGKLR